MTFDFEISQVDYMCIFNYYVAFLFLISIQEMQVRQKSAALGRTVSFSNHSLNSYHAKYPFLLSYKADKQAP